MFRLFGIEISFEKEKDYGVGNKKTGYIHPCDYELHNKTPKQIRKIRKRREKEYIEYCKSDRHPFNAF